MKTKNGIWRHCLQAVMFSLMILITACGDDNNSAGTTPLTTTSTLSGTAATGAAIDGTVVVNGANGGEVSVAINVDGSFSADVTGMTAPFALRAIPNDTSLPTQYSFSSQADVTVNISQLTTLALFLANNQQDLDALVQDWVNQSGQITADALATAQAQTNANFAAQFSDNGLDAVTFDFFSSAFTVGIAGFDALLDSVQVDVDMAASSFSTTVDDVPFSFDIDIDIVGFDIGGIPDDGNGGGGANIAVAAETGLAPEYTWTGGAVSTLSVTRTSDPTTVVWGITTVGNDGIASPLTHGTVDNGVIQTFSTESTLTAGVEYRVSVTRLDDSVGFADFTASAGGNTGGNTNNKVTFSDAGVTGVLTGSDFFPSASARERTDEFISDRKIHWVSWDLALDDANPQNGDGTTISFNETTMISDNSIPGSNLLVSSVEHGSNTFNNWQIHGSGDLNSISSMVLDKTTKTVTFTDVVLEPTIGSTFGPLALNGSLKY